MPFVLANGSAPVGLELSSANVDRLCKACLFGREDGMDDPDSIAIEGILHTYMFSRARLAEHKTDIIAMTDQLPETFFVNKGGGWSFLNMCDRRDGTQWTGLHLMQERLFCLAFGIGYGGYLTPRSIWSICHGSVPYVVFGEGATETAAAMASIFERKAKHVDE